MLEFREPEPHQRREPRRDWTVYRDGCRKRPGEYALIGESINVSIANAIRDQKIKELLREDGYEVTTANNDLTRKPRTADVFIRYNPDLDTNLSPKQRAEVWALHRRNTKEKK